MGTSRLETSVKLAQLSNSRKTGTFVTDLKTSTRRCMKKTFGLESDITLL